jgi:GTP-binding protein
MGFLDEVVIMTRSGRGGKGCVSFRREKFIPKGGPDGGDGGNGGNIIVRATKKRYALSDYGARKHFRAHNGEPGKGKNQSGKNGADLIIEVPVGTIVQDDDTHEILADLVADDQKVLLIPGGRGGRGNQHFATPTHRAPRIAQAGQSGHEKRLRLSLKLLADIGLIGFPNTGKSTLLSRLSMARPKVGAYPFTTRVPNLGVMVFDDEVTLVIADIPGLVEGASRGRGLGLRFLKHIERTRLLLHLLDITYRPDQDILEDFHALRREMVSYNPLLAQKPQIVLVNKIDLCGNETRDPKDLHKALEEAGMESLSISALSGEGLGELKKAIFEKWMNEINPSSEGI